MRFSIHTVQRTTKTASEKRTVPFNSRAIEAVQLLKEQTVRGCPYVFATQNGKHMSYRNLPAMMDKACEAAEVEHREAARAPALLRQQPVRAGCGGKGHPKAAGTSARRSHTAGASISWMARLTTPSGRRRGIDGAKTAGRLAGEYRLLRNYVIMSLCHFVTMGISVMRSFAAP